MASSQKRSIWMGEPILTLLASRKADNVSGTINTAVDRYLTVCQRSLPRLDWRAWCALFDALNGTWLHEGWNPTWVSAEVHDTLGLGTKWEIDQAALVQTLQTLTYAEALAITDAAERFWVSAAQPDAQGWKPLILAIVGAAHVTDA